MNARVRSLPLPLPKWQRTLLWGVPTALLMLFAYALPIWFITFVCVSALVLHDSYRGPGRDWGNT